MLGRAMITMALALLVDAFMCAVYAQQAAAVPPDFKETHVVSVPFPTALDFTPDGRMLVSSKTGQLSVHEDGQTTLALDLADPNGDGNEDDSKVCSNSERGLLGVAVDPQFGTTGNDFVYLYYTYK